METPLQVTFRGMESSEAIEANIREKMAKLENYYDRIMGCRVMVEIPHKHQHRGKLYHVRIDLTLPKEELIAGRDPTLNRAHEDVYVAIRDAFKAIRRQLQDYVRKHYTQARVHEQQPIAVVSELFPMEDYGFLKTSEGEKVYFHRNSVVNNAFDRLEIGSSVRYVETMGEKGPQASTVRMR